MKTVDLRELIKLVDYEALSEQYVKYKLGREDFCYKHSEIESLSILIELMDSQELWLGDFFYSYSIPHINKEFDLIKCFNDFVLNIELKSKNVGTERIIKQLKQNRHYLEYVNKKVIQYCFVSSTHTLYYYDGTLLEEKEIDDLVLLLCLNKEIDIVDLDDVFSPNKMLISPLNSPKEFLDGNYLLTDDQEEKKKRILQSISAIATERFIGITGDAGTGKTLLLYDIANELSKGENVLVIHCGKLCDGHFQLSKLNPRLNIIPAKKFSPKKVENYNYIFLDESQRFYKSSLEHLKETIIECKSVCLFSFDEKQRLSKAENNSETVANIKELCGDDNVYKLSNRIRVNKELIMFISGIFDLDKIPERKYYKDVSIIYEENNESAVNLAHEYEKKGYTYISYTPSAYDARIDFQIGAANTHEVIGQEFDKVCMIMGNNFYYADKKLLSKKHPNPNYLYTKLLYQGLTRARTKILLIITNKDILSTILTTIKFSTN